MRKKSDCIFQPEKTHLWGSRLFHSITPVLHQYYSSTPIPVLLQYYSSSPALHKNYSSTTNWQKSERIIQREKNASVRFQAILQHCSNTTPALLQYFTSTTSVLLQYYSGTTKLKHWVDKCIFSKPENTLTFVGPGSWSPTQFGMHFSVCQESMRFDLLCVRNMGITAKRYMAQKWPYRCILSKPENALTYVVPNSWGWICQVSAGTQALAHECWVLARECWSIWGVICAGVICARVISARVSRARVVARVVCARVVCARVIEILHDILNKTNKRTLRGVFRSLCLDFPGKCMGFGRAAWSVWSASLTRTMLIFWEISLRNEGGYQKGNLKKKMHPDL